MAAEKERDNLATKGDIAAVKGDISELRMMIKGDIDAVKVEIAELKSYIAEVRVDLVKWIVIVNGITAGLLIAAAAVIFGN